MTSVAINFTSRSPSPTFYLSLSLSLSRPLPPSISLSLSCPLPLPPSLPFNRHSVSEYHLQQYHIHVSYSSPLQWG